MLDGRKVLIGLSGSIAAYKICDLIRMLKNTGASVKCVATQNALKFITKETLRALSSNKVYVDMFDEAEYSPEHISLAEESELFILAPATANVIGKIANGICDDLLTSIAAAYKKPIIVAPAMNTGMWENAFVQYNMERLRSQKFIILEPEEGPLACGSIGKGRLCEVEKIYSAAKDILCQGQFLKGKKIVITAGGTKESIDPVRFIGNFSSGKMGLALADCAFKYGAEVELISTFDIEREYKVVKTDTALQMLEAVQESFPTSDSLIMAAAVADYRPYDVSDEKIKKTKDELTLKLVKNFDIVSEMVKIKKDNQVVVGFCAETSNVVDNAKQKIQSKKCDFIVANDVLTAMNTDYNEVTIVDKNLKTTLLEFDSKPNIARKILEFIYDKNRGNNLKN